MSFFINEDFLLHSKTAKEFYHNYAKDLPIIDYHSHLSPEAIADDVHFDNITQIWLAGDHYKWRAQRALGIEEKYITGNASDREKFQKWASVIPYTLRNPLHHWTHMELKNPFGIEELLGEHNADAIFDHTQGLLQKDAFSTQGLLKHFNVELVNSTDDPLDDLRFHSKLANSDCSTKVLPTFRPDKAFNLAKGDEFRSYINSLATVSEVAINDFDSLLDALKNRIDFFHETGCRLADHGLSNIPLCNRDRSVIEQSFKQVLSGNDAGALDNQAAFTYFVLFELCKMYHQKGWAQQFHLGALRNTNTQKLRTLGADTGYDSIGDYSQGEGMSRFFNALEEEESLCKTIIYNLNPADNALFAAMIGNFQGEGIKGKIQFGSGWWYLDQLDGMTQQINTLSNIGLISCFVGMLTDSRSFLSYSRHEYFRRLLCNIFASDIENGLLPRDIPWTGKIIQDICYYNAKKYFNL